MNSRSFPAWKSPCVSSISSVSSIGGPASSGVNDTHQNCEIICNMLAMLSCSEKQDAHKALLAMTNSPESCQSLRRAGCIPLLIQILHPVSTTPADTQPSPETKLRASKALKNIVRFNPDEQMKRKEMRILRLLEAIRSFSTSTTTAEPEKHPTSSATALMRLSFDEEHRNTMCTLGAIHALADLILSDHRIHGPRPTDADCTQIRRYSCMTLTNLTFGDGVNKALLCSMTEFLASLVAQLDVEGEDVVQVTASVLRNLSWHADSSSRTSLMETDAVSGLMKAALRATKESTMKATLSALWNLSAHSGVNKAAICSTPNALKFLLSLLRRNKAMTIVENAGGILRNISSHVAQVEDHHLVLREFHCYEILLEHLKSSSLTVVSNACGTLWNLSGHKEVQRRLIELNAVPMLKSLIYSKHERISQGASAALRNILSFYEQTSDPCQNYDADNDQPLDLTITSCKSSPVRKMHLPAFLNPPLYNGSVSSTRSCPDIQVKQQQVPPSTAAAAAAARKMDSATSDETFNYSHYDEEEEEEEKHQQKDTVKTYCDEGTPGFSGSMVDLSCQAADTCIQFQVEGTPAVFSRTSSLSSIDENQHGENPAEDLDSNKKPTTIVNSGPLTPAPVLQKRVMFSAEETPLMFSRCSSVASLESCGDLNTGRCESDCVSEFSRRTSEVVSPSELPDSPRATDQTPLSPPEQPEESPENELEESKRKQQSGNNDEVKVFAMEGTPFLISTATSLSDIVGELDNQAGSSNLTQAPPPRAPKANILPQPVVEKETCENNDDVDPDDPIYSDVTLLQRCINKGRAVGVAVLKKPSSSSVVEEEEVDLSYLIQKGRKQLFTRSEDNLKQYASSESGSCKTPPLPMPTAVVSRPSENSYASQKQFNGSLPSLNQNHHQRIGNINLNVVPPTVHETPKDTKTEMTTLDCITNGTATLKINVQEQEDLSPNANTIPSIPDESDCKSVNSSNNFKVSSAADDTDNDTLSQSEDTTWTDETPTFSSPIPSMSISKALKKVAAQVEETLSEIDQPTLESLGTTLDSAGYHTDSLQRRQVHNRQLLLLQTSSSQVSNLLNQKPPQEFFDLDSSMISVASIKSEIFEDGIPDSPQLSSSSALGQQHNHQSAQIIPECSTGTSPKNSPPNAPLTPPSKYDTYVIKRVDSPKNRRKDNPERFLTRTIEKCDLKLKPPVPPKPSGSSPQSALSSAPSSSTTAQVRPTRASELRASRSRDHSPTSSTTSLNTSTSCSAVKIPPKPPVRSTPPLNTTLPRNAKLMEGNNTKLMDGNNHPGPNTNGVELPHHQQQPPLPGLPSSSSKDSKLNFGGRIGNLFRKSFNKDKDSSSSGKHKGKDGSSGSKIWVKREKALVPPFNYKPPDQQTGSNASITPTIMPTSTIGSSTSTFTSHNPVQPAISTNILTTTAAPGTTTPTANSPTGPPPQASNNNINNNNASSNNSAVLTSSSSSSNGAPPKSSSKITTV